MTLTRSTDRKTAAAATPNGKGVKVANAFGLPAGKAYSCPGATPLCEKVCYAGRIEKQYKNFLAVMLNNWNALQGKSHDQMFYMLCDMVREFEAECIKKNVPLFFRIHHDGDFFSEDYAKAWANVAKTFSGITFWVYTRSFDSNLNVIPHIVDIPNLSVYLSVDTYNKPAAEKVIADYPQVMIALLADTFADAAIEIEGMRGNDKIAPKCPELTKALPLISEKGGACFACGLCPNGRNDIRFAIKKR